MPSCTVLQWYFLWTTRGDNELQPCGHHVPSAACGVAAHTPGTCSSAGHWLREQGCSGAQEKHGRDTVLLGTKASLPGFCLDSTCQAYRSLGTWEPASADLSAVCER